MSFFHDPSPGRQRNGNPLMSALRSVYEYCVFYGGFTLFGLTSLIWSFPAGLLYPILPRRIGKPLGQWMIMAGFRWFLAMLKLSGIVHLDLKALDALRDERSLIIAPNHPSLLDVVLVVSRLPHVTCIMKAEIWGNAFLGGGARLAGYISNDSPSDMVKVAAKALTEGDQLLVFPEGTRTVTPPINCFKGGSVLMAKKAGAPVQTVFIETDSPFLSKHWPLFKKPPFPLIYRARLGRRFEPGADAKCFMLELENYYRHELEHETAPPTTASAVSPSLS